MVSVEEKVVKQTIKCGTERRVQPLFYEFCLEKHIPDEHLLRQIDQFLDLDQAHVHLDPFYSHTGRPSIDPELMIRMLEVFESKSE